MVGWKGGGVMDVVTVLAYVFALGLVFFAGRLLALPIKVLGRLLLNGIIGGLVLFVLNMVGTLVGFRIALNAFTALIAGTLGIPGVALLVLLRLIMG